MVMHLGFTGTQDGLTRSQEAKLLVVLRGFRDKGYDWMHNGDCLGADHTAACIWRRMGGHVWGHPPINPIKRAWFKFDAEEPEREYAKRNLDIVAASGVLVAAPSTGIEVLRSGTWQTIRAAIRKPLYVHIVGLYGNVRIEHV